MHLCRTRQFQISFYFFGGVLRKILALLYIVFLSLKYIWHQLIRQVIHFVHIFNPNKGRYTVQVRVQLQCPQPNRTVLAPTIPYTIIRLRSPSLAQICDLHR
jgi:hypothetical protein